MTGTCYSPTTWAIQLMSWVWESGLHRLLFLQALTLYSQEIECLRLIMARPLTLICTVRIHFTWWLMSLAELLEVFSITRTRWPRQSIQLQSQWGPLEGLLMSGSLLDLILKMLFISTINWSTQLWKSLIGLWDGINVGMGIKMSQF